MTDLTGLISFTIIECSADFVLFSSLFASSFSLQALPRVPQVCLFFWGFALLRLYLFGVHLLALLTLLLLQLPCVVALKFSMGVLFLPAVSSTFYIILCFIFHFLFFVLRLS